MTRSERAQIADFESEARAIERRRAASPRLTRLIEDVHEAQLRTFDSSQYVRLEWVLFQLWSQQQDAGEISPECEREVRELIA